MNRSANTADRQWILHRDPDARLTLARQHCTLAGTRPTYLPRSIIDRHSSEMARSGRPHHKEAQQTRYVLVQLIKTDTEKFVNNLYSFDTTQLRQSIYA